MFAVKKEIEFLESLPLLDTASQIARIDEVVKSLLTKRAEFLEESGELHGHGFYPKYFVFNNLKKHVDDDCFVLDPKEGDADMEAIQFYAEYIDDSFLKRDLEGWIYAHKNLTCKFPLREHCKIVGYNLCCGHCPNKDECFINGNPDLCNRVANDMFTTIEECDGQ